MKLRRLTESIEEKDLNKAAQGLAEYLAGEYKKLEDGIEVSEVKGFIEENLVLISFYNKGLKGFDKLGHFEDMLKPDEIHKLLHEISSFNYKFKDYCKKYEKIINGDIQMNYVDDECTISIIIALKSFKSNKEAINLGLNYDTINKFNL